MEVIDILKLTLAKARKEIKGLTYTEINKLVPKVEKILIALKDEDNRRTINHFLKADDFIKYQDDTLSTADSINDALRFSMTEEEYDKSIEILEEDLNRRF